LRLLEKLLLSLHGSDRPLDDPLDNLLDLDDLLDRQRQHLLQLRHLLP
jgi:hypothetical protein